MRYTFLTVMMVFAGLAQSSIKPADGLWRSTDDPDIGSGLMLVTQGDITLVSIYSYTNEGKPKWYLAVGQVDDDGLLTADLTETVNGTSILSDSPDSASFAPVVRQLSIQFYGSQTATFTIDDSEYKSIQPFSFGQPAFNTEHFNLSDGTFYAVPDLTGSWVVGKSVGDDGFILSLEEVANEPTGAFLEKTYISSHSSTENWMLSCPYQFFPNTLPISQPHCVLDRNDANLETLQLQFNELGYDRITMTVVGDSDPYIGRRAHFNRGPKPSDGYWRPEDDPAIGSGMVMTTQGDVTVVLLYSYDDQGLPVWQIASGIFDSDGLLQTTLMSTSGGSPIERNGKTTAAFTGLNQSLEIQLLGAELATFSIDGSTPKHIQVNNFGVVTYNTEHFMVGDKNYQFPDLSGHWVMSDSQGNGVSNIDMQSVNGIISPIPPSLPRIYQNFAVNQDNPFDFSLGCDTKIHQGLKYAGCTGSGRFSNQIEADQLLLYFQDIGTNKLRIYFGLDTDTLGRSNDYYELYRLN